MRFSALLGTLSGIGGSPTFRMTEKGPEGPAIAKNSMPIDRVKFSIHTIENFNRMD